ncbi:MAG: 2,3-butanediol dehydrogenase [Termitinemataceae bacterium]|nr:MAG: 2,3-butanediol dehydrogenase [Termitinemataceae bacterium]
MKAAVWHGYKDVRIEERPVPPVPSGHVLVRVAWAGICGTDKHEYAGPNFIPTTKPHRLTGCTAPLIMGHEFSGTIARVSPDIKGWQEGDRVSANGTLSCGECAMCRSGRYNICEKLGFIGVSRDGAFAEYVAVEASRLFKIPDNVSLRHAVLGEPLACGLHAAGLIGNIQDKTVFVCGAGIIGLSCFFAASFNGARKIVVSGLGSGAESGIKSIIEGHGGIYIDITQYPTSGEADNAIKDCLGGLADICFECVGVQASLDNCIRLLKSSGALMVMGVFEKRPTFPMNDFQEGERRLFTSQAHVDEIAMALTYISRGLLDAEKLITRSLTLDNLVKDGFEVLEANPAAHIKMLIDLRP